MENLNNSDAALEEREKSSAISAEIVKEPRSLKPIDVKEKKKHSLKELFIASDVDNIKDYIIYDVLVPSIKDALASTICDSISMLLYGTRSKKHKKNGSKFDYSSSLDERRPRRDRDDDSRSVRDMDPSDYIFTSKFKAEECLEDMRNYIDEYGYVRVSDFWDAAGKTSDYTDKSWVWYSLADVRVRRDGDGWYLDLPRPERMRR